MRPGPDPSTAEGWAHDYLTSTSLSHKLNPPPPPALWADDPEPLRIERPGRPDQWTVVDHADKTPGRDAMRDPRRRARLLHTFLHHELQAAELMCHALLAYPDTPRAFRQGLLAICLDEIRHMGMYTEHIERLGCEVGEFPVNDWFWQRVPGARTAAEYVAVMGLGLEGANLDHTLRFAQRFRDAGDDQAAALQRAVGEEEIPHVAFGAHWFKQWRHGLDFDDWRAALPAPLSPMLMRGRPFNRRDRQRAGYPTAFLDALERWQPTGRGS